MKIEQIDPQEHVDAIYAGAEVLRLEAGFWFDSNTVDTKFKDEEDAETYARMTNAVSGLELAADAFIDLQTVRHTIGAAATDLIESIDLFTDCMTNEVARERIDPWIDKLQLLLDPKAMDPSEPTGNNPAQICLLLSPTFIPALNKATELLRHRLMNASDGELLEQIFFSGIVATIESVERQIRRAEDGAKCN